MKRYAFSGALVCALLLSGCGKIDHTAGPASATQPATAQQFTDAPALEFSAADSDPYRNVIQYYLEQYQSDSAQDDSLPEPTYALYDMDKDGSPELIVRTGYNEAEYTFCVWTTDADKNPVQVEGDASGSHTLLYGSDSENGFFTSGCYMDTQNITPVHPHRGQHAGRNGVLSGTADGRIPDRLRLLRFLRRRGLLPHCAKAPLQLRLPERKPPCDRCAGHHVTGGISGGTEPDRHRWRCGITAANPYDKKKRLGKRIAGAFLVILISRAASST